jgi:hypothetical protein
MPFRKSEPAAARLRAAAGRLVNRVEHWTAARWSQPAQEARGVGETRADAVHALVQRLADLSAGLEGRPPQGVPRLGNDLALPDQLKVMVADLALVGAGDEVLRGAVADIDATTARL